MNVLWTTKPDLPALQWNLLYSTNGNPAPMIRIRDPQAAAKGKKIFYRVDAYHEGG